MNIAEHPGIILRRKIAAKGMTVFDFCKKARIGRSTFYKILSGNQEITYKLAIKISRALESTPIFWLQAQLKSLSLSEFEWELPLDMECVELPGTVLLGEMCARGMNVVEFCEKVGISLSRATVSGIVKGTVKITRRTSIKLGAALGHSPFFWLRLQYCYIIYQLELAERVVAQRKAEAARKRYVARMIELGLTGKSLEKQMAFYDNEPELIARLNSLFALWLREIAPENEVGEAG